MKYIVNKLNVTGPAENRNHTNGLTKLKSHKYIILMIICRKPKWSASKFGTTIETSSSVELNEWKITDFAEPCIIFGLR